MVEIVAARPTWRQWAAWLAPLAVVFSAVLLLATVPIFPPKPASSPAASPPLDRLSGLSARALAGPGDKAVRVAITVGEGDPLRIFITARGPSLTPQGVTRPQGNPRVAVLDATGKVLAENDDWGTLAESARATLVAAGRAPGHPSESALALTLPSGSYSIRADGASGEGVVLLDVFTLDAGGSPRIDRATVRSPLGPGEGVVIAGFNVPAGPARRVAIAARGPSLEPQHGHSGSADLKLEVVAAAGPRLVAESYGATDSTAKAAIERATNRPLAERDAAVLLALPPGAYMAIALPAPSAQSGDVELEIVPKP